MRELVKSVFVQADGEEHVAVGARRLVFAGLTLATMAALLALMMATLSPGGLSPTDALVLVLFALTLPTLAVGFWNAAIGVVLMWSGRDIVALTCPPAGRVTPDDPVTTRTALLVCIRNEDVGPVAARLSAMLDELERAGVADRFAPFVLSDTNIDEVALEEAKTFSELQARHARAYTVTYRRRTDNAGFKAGNIRDFCDRWGDQYDFALTLDADSYMSASAILKLVRTMQASPKLGILQSFIQSMPSTSPFARIFQFGWRSGGLARTIGSDWWLADCGPYGGHNAVIRLAPFMAHCKLPKLEGNGALSGWIMSHDHIEEVLMRRAGYATRELPEIIDSFEEQPPNIAEFIRREMRWCSGNLQYLRLLGIPGLPAAHRVQMLLWILHFLGSAASMLMLFVFSAGFLLGPTLGVQFEPAAGATLFFTIMALIFLPKIAVIVDMLVRPRERAAWGGSPRLMGAAVGEVVFSTILAPVAALTHTMVVLSAPFGRRPVWNAQKRGAHGLTARAILANFWPHMAIGVAWFAMVALSGSLVAALFMLPFLIGLIGVVPFGLVTASPALGRAMIGAGLFSLPEERVVPASLALVPVDALAGKVLPAPVPAHAAGQGHGHGEPAHAHAHPHGPVHAHGHAASASPVSASAGMQRMAEGAQS